MDEAIVKHTKMLVVGSGGNAIALAVSLIRAGYSDLGIITKHHDFGGAWLQNTYPGCEVDCKSAAYQFSFDLNADWSALYATQPELKNYLQKVARDGGLYERTIFNCAMTNARWDETRAHWIVGTTCGSMAADHLLLATGFLEEAVTPDLPGFDSFRGASFHSSRWPAGYTGKGERIAVLGSGSSAAQIVPAMQETADHVYQFQRTPTWMLPKGNRALSAEEKQALRSDPAELQKQRDEVIEMQETAWNDVFVGSNSAFYLEISQKFLADEVPDPVLRAHLTPDHALGCKRPVISDNYYRSLGNPNVTLVPEGVTRIEDGRLVTASGREFEVDTIVLATGFYFGGHILDLVQRRDGQSVGSFQAGHPRAYKAISVAGCPNLYLVGGPAPNGQIWNGLYPGEGVAAYVIRVMEYLQAHDLRAVEVTHEAEIAWKAATDEILDKSPVVAGGCVNYAQDSKGHNKATWPGNLASMTMAMSHFEASDYHAIRGLP
ncbi:NAD(P)/FAD-dependent oxidoreductase [Rhodobacter sp. 24-YEA-8]|uniref:flavin-containing monooxygenase n=1 Tax=Rhodobacter sp. 24-YEA-8 TaxID=1884310 RepID=UPI000896B885|nr:NAD(P)/FAD-dependent oxidoreductase [Rhodobacter sp. 24-YEA-8]SED48157.1 Predicted flavoprotein CzcO associated with the cation diffusion facilitator CzcD [Rhodobacter sp. 24-YEA-8]